MKLRTSSFWAGTEEKSDSRPPLKEIKNGNCILVTELFFFSQLEYVWTVWLKKVIENILKK